MWNWIKNLFKRQEVRVYTPKLINRVPPAVIRHLMQLKIAMEMENMTEVSRLQDLLDKSGWCRPITISQVEDKIEEYQRINGRT